MPNLVRQLLRLVMRGLYRMPSVPESVEARLCSSLIRKCDVKAEIRHYVLEESRKTSRNDRALYTKLCLAEELEKALHVSHLWEPLVKLVVQHREASFKRAQWRGDYIVNKERYDEERRKHLPRLIQKRIESRNAKKGTKKEDKAYLMRLHLKQQQKDKLIPNPYKLAYISPDLFRHNLNRPRHILPGTTKANILHQAYDTTYIDAVLGPEVRHQATLADLERARNTVNKGPFPVKIRFTNAGAMRAHYIRMPFPRWQLQKMAMDIKRLMRLMRTSSVWAGEETAEKRVGEGYEVRGSRGFGVSEVMYPREYYEEYAEGEALWEALVSKQSMEATAEAWMAPLDTSTDFLKREGQRYIAKYNKRSLDRLKATQKRLQQLLNQHHRGKKRRLQQLLKDMEGVHAHSDMVLFR